MGTSLLQTAGRIHSTLVPRRKLMPRCPYQGNVPKYGDCPRGTTWQPKETAGTMRRPVAKPA